MQWATGPLDPAGHGDPPAGAELDDDPEAIHRLLSFINPYHQMFRRETEVQSGRGTGGRPAGGAGADRGGLVHPALFYTSNQEYRANLVPFITDGLAAAEPVLVAVPGERIELLRTGLGRAADQVRFVDMTDAGRNPGRIIPRLLCAFVDEHPAQSTRVIGEPIWAGRSAAEYPACVQHEALINVALADRPVTIVCPYDTARLDPAVLADAECTHPLLIEHGQWRPTPTSPTPRPWSSPGTSPCPNPPRSPPPWSSPPPTGPARSAGSPTRSPSGRA